MVASIGLMFAVRGNWILAFMVNDRPSNQSHHFPTVCLQPTGHIPSTRGYAWLLYVIEVRGTQDWKVRVTFQPGESDIQAPWLESVQAVNSCWTWESGDQQGIIRESGDVIGDWGGGQSMSFGVILGRILVRCSTGPSLCLLILA